MDHGVECSRELRLVSGSPRRAEAALGPGKRWTEFYYRRVWPTQAGAQVAVGAWIEDRYNRRRRHSSIGQISPVAFEMQHSNQTATEPQAA